MGDTKEKNDILSTMSTSVMQNKKDRPPAAQAVGNSIANANTSRNVHSASALSQPEDKPRIRHSKRNNPVNSLPQPRPMNKPILEGLDKAPSAYIAINGSGYDSSKLKKSTQSNQEVYTKETPVPFNMVFAKPGFRSSSLKDYTYGISKEKLQV